MKHFAQPLARLRRLATALQARVLPRSGLVQACAYLLGHWTPLTAHLRHSCTRLDTSTVENAPPQQARREELALCRPPRHWRSRRRPLHADRLLPTPRPQSSRLPARYPRPLAGPEHGRRPAPVAARTLATAGGNQIVAPVLTVVTAKVSRARLGQQRQEGTRGNAYRPRGGLRRGRSLEPGNRSIKAVGPETFTYRELARRRARRLTGLSPQRLQHAP